MVSPPEEVGHLCQEADDPETKAHDDSVGQGEDPLVVSVVADVYVSVEGDCSDAQQAAETGGQTDGCNDLTKPALSYEPLFAKKNSLKTTGKPLLLKMKGLGLYVQ